MSHRCILLFKSGLATILSARRLLESPQTAIMSTAKKACFFSHENKAQLQKEQYSIQDIRILHDLGYDVTVATTFGEIPSGCDLYFSWWATGSILPLIKARLLGKPIVVVAGGNDSMFYRDSLTGVQHGYLATPWYKKVAARLTLRFASAVLVVSRFMVDDVTRLGARAPIVIPNSVDTTTFCSSDSPRSHVTSIFNLYDHVVDIKRGEVFLRSIPIVLKTFPRQTFVIIGDQGNAYQRLCALASDLRIQAHVDFLGSMPNTEVVSWLQRSKIYVQISDTETFGMVIAEAMSCETPVVVSHRGAIPELVDGRGVFVDHNDPQSVAAGIVSLLAKSPEEGQIIGTQARARIVEHFSYENRRTAIQRVIEGLSSPETLSGLRSGSP